MSSANLLHVFDDSSDAQQHMSSSTAFPGPLDKSSSFLRASSAPSSIIYNGRGNSRRRSSAASLSNHSNPSLPTTIFTKASSNSSLGGTSKRSRGDSRSVKSAPEARTNRKIDVAIAQTIASDSQLYSIQLVDNQHLFKDFQTKLTQNGTITNLAAKEVLRDDVMKSKCYLSQKHQLVSQHEERATQAAAQGAGGAVEGMRRVLSSAFSLDTLAGLEMECSASNFGNIDLAEQHAIMSEILASRNQQPSATAASSRRRSSVASSISGGAGSGAYHDTYPSQASSLSSSVPNAAQVLANSLGNQVKRISMSLSSVAKPHPYDGSSSSGMNMSYNRSSSIPSMITSSTAPSSTYTGHSSYRRCSSLSNVSRRSSVESLGSTNTFGGGVPPTGTIYDMNLNDLKHDDLTAEGNMSASTLNTDQTPQRRGSRRLSNLRMSFLAFGDVFDEDLHEVSDEDQSTSGSEHGEAADDNGNHTTTDSADTSSKSFDHARHEMDTIALQDQALAAKLQSAEIQEELLCAWPHQLRAAARRRRASMASDSSSITEYEQDVKKSADDELNAQTTEMRRQFYRRMSDHRLNRMGSDRTLPANGKKKDGDNDKDHDFHESFSTIKKARAA